VLLVKNSGCIKVPKTVKFIGLRIQWMEASHGSPLFPGLMIPKVEQRGGEFQKFAPEHGCYVEGTPDLVGKRQPGWRNVSSKNGSAWAPSN
jgi:hypothetical protein